jgi:hypothetical protein
MSLDEFKLPEPENDADRKLLTDVRAGGWHVVLIPGDAETPGWAFTIGLYANFDHPEIVVFGLPRHVAHPLLNEIGEQVKAGQRFESDQLSGGLLEGVDCTFRLVRESWYPPFLGYANWFHQGTNYPVLQLIWPDKEQHFPWDASFREDWLFAQPLLHHEDAAEARVEALLESMENEREDAEEHRDAVSNKFAIPGDQIRPLASGHGGCFFTDMIMVEGRKVGFMYREEPDFDIDSGWRFLSGLESQEYLDDADNSAIYDVNTVANYDPEIIRFLDAPHGSAFERIDGEGEFEEVEFSPHED